MRTKKSLLIELAVISAMAIAALQFTQINWAVYVYGVMSMALGECIYKLRKILEAERNS